MTPRCERECVAGFRGVAAVGRSIELLLNDGFAAEEPVKDGVRPTKAKLVRTDDIAPPAAAVPRPGLSILLYRVDFDKTLRPMWAAVAAEDGRSHLPVDLHYLLTAWGDNATDEHLVIGATMHLLESSGGLTGTRLLGDDAGWATGESVELYLEDIPTEDLMRTFDSLRSEFRLSIPYVARVVVLSGPLYPQPPDVVTATRALRPLEARR